MSVWTERDSYELWLSTSDWSDVFGGVSCLCCGTNFVPLTSELKVTGYYSDCECDESKYHDRMRNPQESRDVWNKIRTRQ